MEPVSASGCEQWQGAIALEALGTLEPGERAGLLAHLDGCAACRDLARELSQTASVLALLDRDDVWSAGSVPPALTDRVLGALHDDALAARRRRRLRVGGVVAAVGAIAASVALLLALGTPGPVRGTQTAILNGPGTLATATVVMSPRPWGTAMTFTERGLPAGGIYVVSARTAGGSWWAAGSVNTAKGPIVGASMSCYVPLGRITGLRVTDAAGASVLVTGW